MLQNMGKTDRIIRTVVAVAAIAALYFSQIISGVVATIIGIVALVLLITSLVGFCPAYFPFKISTREKTPGL